MTILVLLGSGYVSLKRFLMRLAYSDTTASLAAGLRLRDHGIRQRVERAREDSASSAPGFAASVRRNISGWVAMRQCQGRVEDDHRVRPLASREVGPRSAPC